MLISQFHFPMIDNGSHPDCRVLVTNLASAAPIFRLRVTLSTGNGTRR
jgi:hypothetical protein